MPSPVESTQSAQENTGRTWWKTGTWSPGHGATDQAVLASGEQAAILGCGGLARLYLRHGLMRAAGVANTAFVAGITRNWAEIKVAPPSG